MRVFDKSVDSETWEAMSAEDRHKLPANKREALEKRDLKPDASCLLPSNRGEAKAGAGEKV